MLLPPVLIELSITKPQYLSQQVQDGVKHQVEEDQPQQMVRQLKLYTKSKYVCIYVCVFACVFKIRSHQKYHLSTSCVLKTVVVIIT